MKFARYEYQGAVGYGVVESDGIQPITSAPFEPFRRSGHPHSPDEVKLLAPCVPGKILAMALNYRSHLGQAESPKKPELFFKVPTSVIGPGEAIILPKEAGRVDEEAELVVVMGRRCRRVSPAQALGYVLGYTCGNDVSARVWQRGDLQWWRAKSSDTFSPLGPYLVTDIDPARLEILARVNGQEVQRCHTSELLYDVPTIISFVSQVLTLEPGDLIYTGTSGRPAQLHDGDTVEIEIEGIGMLRNPVAAER